MQMETLPRWDGQDRSGVVDNVSALPETVGQEEIAVLPEEKGMFIIFALHYLLLAHVLGTNLALPMLLLRCGELQNASSF